MSVNAPYSQDAANFLSLVKFEQILLKLINNSCIHKPIRIRQFGQVRVVWNPDETLDRGLSTIVW